MTEGKGATATGFVFRVCVAEPKDVRAVDAWLRGSEQATDGKAASQVNLVGSRCVGQARSEQ